MRNQAKIHNPAHTARPQAPSLNEYMLANTIPSPTRYVGIRRAALSCRANHASHSKDNTVIAVEHIKGIEDTVTIFPHEGKSPSV